MKYLPLIFFCCAFHCIHAQTYTVETVPNTKLVNNSYVSNPDGIISDSTVARINLALDSLERNTTVQVALVILNSIGDEDEFDFSQRLFEHWGIGHAQSNNGLLILFVKDRHVIRFHTGDGLEGALPDARCKQIQRRSMVPYFKEGRFDDGMIAGMVDLANVIYDPVAADAFYSNDNSKPAEEAGLEGITFFLVIGWCIIIAIVFLIKRFEGAFSGSKKQLAKKKPTSQLSTWGWLLCFAVIPVALMVALTYTQRGLVLFGGLYAYLTAMVGFRRLRMESRSKSWLEAKEFQKVHTFYDENQSYFSAMRFFFPIPFAFTYGKYKKEKDHMRNYPRNCETCGKAMTKLDEAKDDLYLDKGQIMEEKLASVDYDVWRCDPCDKTERVAFVSKGTKYSECPKCKARVYHIKSSRILRAATTSSAGQGVVERECKNCEHKENSKYTIAKIIPESSSSSSSSSSSWSSSSSSSGGSWGGGSSSGGGASSSW